MQTRKGIQAILRRAWIDCIHNDYVNRLINSERSLQASYWAAIKAYLPKNRQIYIEPSFKIDREGRKITPDLIITSREEVIAVIELKYLPKGKSKFQKDIYSLGSIARYRKKLTFKNNRYLGLDTTPKEYKFSDSVLFVWAGVYNRLVTRVGEDFSNGNRYLKGCYMQLDAVTGKDSEPVVYQLTS